MSYKEEIKNINSLIPNAMLRDQAFISRKLKNLHKKRGNKGRKQDITDKLVSLRKKAEASAGERQRRSRNLPRVDYPDNLPISSRRKDIVTAIRENQVVIISGETGSGKSTQIPKMCLEAGRGISGKIGCTQPRRIAASTISRRIAEELGEDQGKSVGYKIRFKDRTPRKAYIKVLTDGMLLAETQGDRDLHEYDTLIIDEAHERSLNIDFILGFLRLLLPRRPELKVIITSATLDTQKFSRAFGNAPVIEVSGRLFPVEVKYMPLDPDLEDKGDITYVDMAVEAVNRLRQQKGFGDILIFMPTEQDILETCERLEGRKYQGTTILPLFARLPSSSQGRVYSVKGDKIVVATNVAETSLTIPGIKYVIDSGLARISRYLPRTRTNSMPIDAVSKSSADQRKGRCGRVREGVCIRLYSEDDYEARPEFTLPEILRSNLAEVILRMVYLKLGDPSSFPFIDPPNPRSIKDGFDILEELGAVEKKARKPGLTYKGRLMARMPLDPRISRMMIEAAQEGYVEEIAVIASALSIQDPRERPPEKASQADRMHSPFKDQDSDFLTLYNIWKRFHREWETLKTQNKMRKFCKSHFLSFPRMRDWIYTHDQIISILRQQEMSINSRNQKTEPSERYAGIHRSILSGFLTNIALKKEKNIYQSSRGRAAMIFPGSTLFNKNVPWIVAAEMVQTSRLFARNAAKIDPAWLEKLGGSLCKSSYQDPHWKKNRGEVRAYENVTLYGLTIVSRRPVSYGPVDPEEAHEIFVRSALVQEDIKPYFEFLKHNRKLIKKFRTMEDKLRRKDIMAGEEALAQFYSTRLKEINNVRDLSKLIKETGDDFLKMKEEDLLLAKPDDADLAMFPDELKIGKARLKATYRFIPGKEEDGVTFRVPSTLAPEIPASSLEWGVPGMVKEKFTALIKGLPKRYRKQLVPVSDTVDIIMKELKQRNQPMINTLSSFIYQRFGVDIPASVWNEVEIPGHLRTRLSITDHRGKEIQSGRDIPGLLQGKEATSPDSEAWRKLRAKWEMQEVTDWDFDQLPEEISIDSGLFAYPGLEPCGNTVNVRLFTTRDRAVASHKRGVSILLKQRLAKDIKLLKRNWPLQGEAVKSAAYFGGKSAVENAIFNGLEKQLFHKNIRSRDEFDSYAKTVSKEISDKLREIRDNTIAVLSAHHRTRSSLYGIEKGNKSNRPVLKLCSAVRADMDHLLPVNFPEHYTPERLADIPRYLRAMEIRAERGSNDPVKDIKKAGQVEGFIKAFREMYDNLSYHASEEKKQGVEKLRWMIEEFKVSVFAQELGTAFPVSSKRLNKFKDELVRMV